MATILAHITVREGAETTFEAVARELFVGTHALETGVRAYEYWRGSEPRTYYTLLSFDDFPTFISHQTSEHHETASPQLGAVIESMRLEWVDPIEGASKFVTTEMKNVAPGADELTVRYSKRFAAEIADWWLTVR